MTGQHTYKTDDLNVVPIAMFAMGMDCCTGQPTEVKHITRWESVRVPHVLVKKLNNIHI